MPTPKKDEKRSEFVSRCVSYLYHNEGITNTDHAVAKCNGIFDQHKKKSLIKKFLKTCHNILKLNHE